MRLRLQYAFGSGLIGLSDRSMSDLWNCCVDYIDFL